ncbi:MAG: low molecular weight phosphatase family protein [Thermoplasmata archaeon]
MVKRVLFICVGNSFRSQMAEGFARHHAARGVLVRSGGVKPASQVSPVAVRLMGERNIDISLHVPKEVDMAFARQADRIVTMGCSPEEACPANILDRAEEWSLPDPGGMGEEEARGLRDEIEGRVRGLLAEL